MIKYAIIDSVKERRKTMPKEAVNGCFALNDVDNKTRQAAYVYYILQICGAGLLKPAEYMRAKFYSEQNSSSKKVRRKANLIFTL